MKKFLIPIDFSETSKNALKYGADLAVALGAEISILHVFQIPVSVSDSYVYIPDQEEIDGIKKAHLAELELIIKEIKQYNPQVQHIEAVCISGIPFEEIKEYSKNHSYDLIIMGLQGLGFVARHILGSTTAKLFSKSEIPVLGVHKHNEFKGFKHILFSYDMIPFENNQALKPLVDLSHFFHSHIHVLNITDKPEELTQMNEMLEAKYLKPSLVNSNTSYHTITNSDLISGIEKFIKTQTHEIDLLTIFPRKHNIFAQLFINSASKDLAFHFDLPLLVNHE